MGLQQERKVFYLAPASFGDNEFQEQNLGLSLREVTQNQFLEDVFGDFSGYLCIFQKRSNGTTANTLYKKDEQEKMVGFLKKTFGQDTYISYSTYYKKNKKKTRTQDNIVHTYMLVQDLDYYKFGITDQEFLQKIGSMIQNGEILCPNYIVSTGQGYQLIWLVEPFKNIAGYTNDRDWHTIQEFLYEKLKEFNSDSVVKNPSAVTRLPGSKHRKTGNLVYGFKANEARFDLKDFMFSYNLVPTPDRQVKPKKKQGANAKESIKNTPKTDYKPASVTRMVGNWNEYTLNKQREEDIFVFVRVQNERKNSYIGIRNWLALVLRFHALVSSDGDTEYARERVLQLCSIMDMTETTVEEILRRSEGAQKYYEDWVNDTWDKNKYMRGGLFYTNARMLDLMNIKDDYFIQWKMKTIKIKNKAYEAARKRFEKFAEEEAEKHTWEAYQERRNEKLAEQKEDKLWQLKEAMKRMPNATQKELAKYLGFNQSTISRLKKQLNVK